MNLLLDTHILLWSLAEPARLSEYHREAIESPSNHVWVSSISIWEAVIKSRAGKLTLPPDFVSGIRAQNFEVIAFTSEHALAVVNLPVHHKDPFDRALIAQSQVERLSLVSMDQGIRQYSGVADILPDSR